MNQWSDVDAATYCQRYASYGEDIALRVYTTCLLGSDPSLVLHGGGNTSVKTQLPDELGRLEDVLCVKGSGWDMGSIEPKGLPAVRLHPIQDFRQCEALSDEAMVNGVRRHLLDVSSPTPSVETLLHAFLPHKFIDHTHADEILAIADQAEAVSIIGEIYGDRFGIVPYIMPGFALAKETARIYDENPDVEGLILVNHGIFTFGETAKEAYDRMIDAVVLAKEWREKHHPSKYISYKKLTPNPNAAISVLKSLRGLLSGHERGIGHQVLHLRHSSQIEGFLNREDLADVSTRGPATPDHIIRTKKKPLILQGNLNDCYSFKIKAKAAIEGFVQDYDAYFETQVTEKGIERNRLQPLPVVFLVPGLGLITAGKTMKAAKIAADIYEHTIDVIEKAEAVAAYAPLPDSHLFDMEYWSLEQAKLGKKKPLPLEGQIVLITGALGGIGRATAARFARMGANLVLTDLQPLDKYCDELKKQYGIETLGLVANMTDEAQVKNLIAQSCLFFGGLDGIVSNAGVATTEPMIKATQALKNSLEINLLSHQYLAAASCRLMKDQGLGGCLLFNASKSAFNPGPGFGAYAIAKAGLVALMKQYAVEHAADGIRAMAINADRIRTNLFSEKLLNERAKARGLTPDAYFRANLLGREVLAEDVANAFYQLYLSEKSTAMVMTVDGGNIAASTR